MLQERRQALGAGMGARGAGRERAGRGACGVGERGARPGRACAHGGHTGWVSWASLSFGEPGSVLTQFF